VIFYRITWARFDRTETAFSGEPASKVAHRWNHPSPDIRVVYCSDSLALACLEILVHVRPLALGALPASVYYTVNVPDRMLEVPDRATLPAGWDDEVAGNASQDYGMAFLRARRAAGLVVPTVIQPLGVNIVLNPLHPAFSLAWVRGPSPYPHDARLA
jgi:RES domain-containing protein